MEQPSLFDQDCEVCGTPLRGRTVYGAHLGCANVRELRELKHAVRALAQSGTVPAPVPSEQHAPSHAPESEPHAPADEDTEQPHAATEAEADAPPEFEPAPETDGEEPAPDPEGAAPAASSDESAEVSSAPVEISPEELVQPNCPELADYTAAAVVGPGWVQIGNRRWSVPVHSAADIVRIRQALRHSTSVPQVYLLAETCQQLGLVVTLDDLNVSTSTQIETLENRLAELPASAEFMRPAYDNGWSSNGVLEPWTLLRSEKDSKGQLVQLVLEPYGWVYDYQGEGLLAEGIDPDKDYPHRLDGSAEQRADALLRRVHWIDTHLGVLPGSNAARTIERVHEQIRRKKLRSDRSTDAKGRTLNRVETEPGKLPEMEGVCGFNDIEPELNHPRPPTHHEIDRAEVLVELDQRAAYLASFKSALLGLGEPSWVDGDAAALVATETAHTFGVWRCQPRIPWHEPRLWPVHPHMRTRSMVWAMGPTLDIARSDEDKGGAGWTLHDLNITGAWIWPDAGHLLEPLYNVVRPALLASASIEDASLRGASAQHVSAGYKALNGRFEYAKVLDSHQPWRWQPMWRRAIIAATRARLFRQVSKIARERDLWPVHSVTDSAWYLTTQATLTEWHQADNGNLGVLRPKRVHRLSEQDRDTLRALDPNAEKTPSVPAALNLTDEQ